MWFLYIVGTEPTPYNIMSLHGGWNQVISIEEIKLRFERRIKPNVREWNYKFQIRPILN